MFLNYDLFLMETDGAVRWIETVACLDDAKKRVLELPVSEQTRYLILDHKTGNKYVVDPKTLGDQAGEERGNGSSGNAVET